MLLRQTNDGGVVVLQSGREEVTPTETFKTSNNNDIDMDAGTDPPECAQMAYEAMLESVDTERRRRGASRTSSLNVLDVPDVIGAPHVVSLPLGSDDDVLKLPFHLAYAVLIERRGAEIFNGWYWTRSPVLAP